MKIKKKRRQRKNVTASGIISSFFEFQVFFISSHLNSDPPATIIKPAREAEGT